MDDNKEKISKHFSLYFTAYCLSSAILEDYSKVIAKLENVTEKEVKDRVNKRATEIGEKFKKENPA